MYLYIYCEAIAKIQFEQKNEIPQMTKTMRRYATQPNKCHGFFSPNKRLVYLFCGIHTFNNEDTRFNAPYEWLIRSLLHSIILSHPSKRFCFHSFISIATVLLTSSIYLYSFELLKTMPVSTLRFSCQKNALVSELAKKIYRLQNIHPNNHRFFSLNLHICLNFHEMVFEIYLENYFFYHFILKVKNIHKPYQKQPSVTSLNTPSW